METVVPNRDGWFKEVEGFPRPDWQAIGDWIAANVAKDQWFEAWHQASLIWVGRLKSRLQGVFEISQSKNFVLLAPTHADRHKKILQFLESTRRGVLTALEGIASDEGYGKHVVLVFQTLDEYYAYVAYFYPDCRDIGVSSGMFLHDGYMHFVTSSDDLMGLGPILAHELTHDCLAHLPLPPWLNEGLALSLENAVVGSAPFSLDRELVEQHREFWTAETIQEFWSGKSFHRGDDGAMLSYSLSQVLMLRIHGVVPVGSGQFCSFVLDSRYEDAGSAAAQKHLGLNLTALIEGFLGPGDWTLKPHQWKQAGPVEDKEKEADKGANT